MITFLVNKKRRQTTGFLMAEAVFSVFITFLVVLTLQSLVKNISTVKNLVHPNEDLAYSYIQLDRFLHEKGTFSYTLPDQSNAVEAVFCKIQASGEKKIYIIEQYNNMIRVKTDHGGHMPLALNIYKARFVTKDQMIKFEVTEKDRRDSELIFRLEKKPHENAKNKR